jgi:ABC-type uncharacterized transport system fused permease/ATPase subunit
MVEPSAEITTQDNSPEVVAFSVQKGSVADATGRSRQARNTILQRIAGLWQFMKISQGNGGPRCDKDSGSPDAF